MPTLVSPGVSITVTDESQYGPGGNGTVPLVILATRSEKDNVSGSGFAEGTIPANANKPYLLTSQRELIELFGKPYFEVIDGTPVHGSEMNEYGLMAAYSYLGLANRAYVLRADIDLKQLDATTIEPKGLPNNGTYWLDLTSATDSTGTSWGIFESSGTGTSNWKAKTPLVISTLSQTVGGLGVLPLASLGSDDDYAVVATTAVSSYAYYKKVSGTWTVVTNAALGTTVHVAPHYQVPTAAAAGEVWIKSTNPNNGLNVLIKRYFASTRQWGVVRCPSYASDSAASTAYGPNLVANVIYAKLAAGTGNVEIRKYDGTNWGALNEVPSISAPTGDTPDGTLWYNTDLSVDLYIKDLGKWIPVPSSIITIDAEMPETPSTGDYWIDSNDPENYPKIYQWDGSDWVPRDIKDQTTPNGVIFADLTLTAADTSNGGGATGIEDSPDPLLHPDGMLLWNTAVSTGNVKIYGDILLGDGVTTVKGWSTFSGNMEDGRPYMFRKAQRRAVVRAMQAVVQSNTVIREEMTYFTLITCPGYPELLDEMLALNVDRKETGFVILDTPFRLRPQGQEIKDWVNGTNAVSNGEDGITSTGSYQAAVYYPSALTTDLDGNDVVVPASHIALRTYGYNDQVAYPWFAPAGLTRGLVTNASNVGYINSEGEFVPTALNNGQRDVLYGDGSRIGINPITRFPGQGLFVFGQRTMQSYASALDRVNVARLLAYLRERFEPLARPFIFEPNDKITRSNVKQVFDSFLADMISKRAIYDFIVVCDETNNTPARIDRNELWIDVAIEPVKAVEFIYIPIRVVNTGELSA